METLRSPKQLTGPALGIPSLTFQAWFEAQFGETAWTQLDKIPRLQWMDYLRWYRRVLALPAHNDHSVRAVSPRADGVVELCLDTPAGEQRVRLDASYWPRAATDWAAHTCPTGFASFRLRRAHSSHALDAERLSGKRVAVLGAGLSAMDSAATALEAGAASVDLLIRRQNIPRINKSKGSGNPGIVQPVRLELTIGSGEFAIINAR